MASKIRKMPIFNRTTKNVIARIDEFFDNIDLGLLVFREAIKAYCEKDMETFHRHLLKIDTLEGNADKLQRSIETEMITHSILPQHRAEVTRLIDELDEIIDSLKHTLNEFSIELPVIPDEITRNITAISDTSVSAAEALIPAARAYFTAPYTVREKLIRVYFFESETDRLAMETKKAVFQEMNGLDLAHKSQMRFIIQQVESISDLAQKAADLLSAMAIMIIL
jgi:uncharacterized protein